MNQARDITNTPSIYPTDIDVVGDWQRGILDILIDTNEPHLLKVTITVDQAISLICRLFHRLLGLKGVTNVR